jgi:hypothetical protein
MYDCTVLHVAFEFDHSMKQTMHFDHHHLVDEKTDTERMNTVFKITSKI